MAREEEGWRVNPVSLISDEPSRDEDELHLGMEAWAKIVASVAVGTDGPFTIGLFAPWGQGKTSVLRRACQLAAFEPNVHTFVVNAWEHERHPDPLHPILEDILRAIDARLGTEVEVQKRKSLAGLKRIMSVLILGAGAFALGAPSLALAAPMAADLISGMGKAAGAAAKAGADIQKEAAVLEELTSVQASGSGGTGLRGYLEAARQTYLPNDKVIVFVDDLDRCSPEKALMILECIKHLLWSPGFVFVLALDNEMLEKTLRHRYESEHGLKDDPEIGKKYLEKLVQVSIPLPKSDKRFEDYVRRLLSPKEGLWRLPESMLGILVASGQNNPRRVKRRINDLIVDRMAYKAVREGDWTVEEEDDERAVHCLAVHRLFGDLLDGGELRALERSERLRREVLEELRRDEDAD